MTTMISQTIGVPPIDPADEVIFRVLRTRTATAEELQAALSSIDLDEAEVRVEELEQGRRRLLATGASDAALDNADALLKAANRRYERLAAAKAQIPDMVASRKAIERNMDARVEKVQTLAKAALATLPAIDAHVLGLVVLIDMAMLASEEAAAANVNLQEHGMFRRSLDRPLDTLASRFGCSTADLHELSSLLRRARERIESPNTTIGKDQHV